MWKWIVRLWCQALLLNVSLVSNVSKQTLQQIVRKMDIVAFIFRAALCAFASLSAAHAADSAADVAWVVHAFALP